MTDTQLVPDDTRNLIERLVGLTENGQLEWETGSAKTEFVLIRPNGSLTIRSVDADGQHPFEFNVLDANGVVVETVTSYDEEHTTGISDDLSRLYAAARKSTVKASPVVKDLLASLPEKEDDIPF